MLFTKDEATAAQRTRTAYLVDVTDGFTPEPTLDLTTAGDIQISKNGGAFANWAGTVTEVADGVYKLVYAAADLDTLGSLTTKIEDAAARVVMLEDQVVAFDLNTATVPLAADAVGSSQLAATAVTELQVGLATSAEVAAIALATRTIVVDLGRMEADGNENTDGDFVAISVLDCLDATVNISGTWDGATATVYTTNDPAAETPVWTSYVDVATDNPLTADGTVIVVGGAIAALKVEITNDGAGTDVGVSVSIRKPAGA